MPKITYVPKKFSPAHASVIDQATAICEDYAQQGYSLTLRQLYYQFIARDLMPNNDKSYSRLGDIIRDARLAGQFDWNFIIDRTRNLVQRPKWSSPEALIEGAAKQYLTDTWAPQKRRLEVWIEKDAAIGVVEYVCNENNVPYFSCRGYTSSTEMWAGAQRIGENLRNGEQTVILHIGDHDPSGLDMSRDIEERLRLFVHRDWVNEFGTPFGPSRGGIRESMRTVMRERGSEIENYSNPWAVKRIALTIGQIEQYEPPPNYAKSTDSRYERYVEETGLTDSWEMDALEPSVLEELIQDEIDAFRDDEKFAEAEIAQEKDRAVLTLIKDNWAAVKNVDWAAITTAQGAK